MATQRLRRQLDSVDDRVLASSGESFCFFGTPLPSLDSKKRDVNELKPIWEQEVRDEQGRRRLHGAFTGGWSAGYFNTVGSKEGWTPSTFKSSRADKAKGKQAEVKQARPEDFMDDEDLEEMREARELANKDGYGMASEAAEDPMAVLFGAEAVKDGGLPDVRPASSSIGTQLLQKMGWRPGQGLGPRVTAARRKRMLLKSGVSAAELEEEHDEEAAKHLFAPPDTRLMVTDTGKSDLKGLGYAGPSSLRMGGLEEALRRAREEQSAASREDRGGGFGISVLENDSDGEDEMYAAKSDIRQSTLGRGGRGSRWDAGTRPEKGAELGDDSRRSTDENKWHDGRPCLAGFRVASKVLDQDAWFKAPPIPPGWKPDPNRVWAVAAAARGPPPAALQPLASTSAHNLRPDDRGSILGEARMPGPPPSILNYLSAKDRERLERARESGAATGAAPPGPPPPPPPSAVPIEIPPTDPMTALAALRGFMPFGNDPSKQERYRSYLESQANPSSAPKLKPAPHQTTEQLNHELREFAKSANIFRPMSSAMASRFKSASSSAAAGEIAQPAPGLYQPERKKEVKKAGADEEQEEEQSPAQQAARAGMFGALTRKTSEWYPDRLLCKRFNVPMPHPDKAREKQNEAEDAERPLAKGGRNETPRANAGWEASKRQIEQLASSRAWEAVGGDSKAGRESDDSTTAAAATKKAGEPQSLATVGLGEDEAQGADTLTYVKPPIDIFKAVFASDDEEEEDEVGVEAQSGVDVGTAPVTSSGSVPPPPSGPDASDPASSFRPTFVPRSKRRAAEDGSDGEALPTSSSSLADGSGRKKKKKTKEGKRSKGMLTFDLDEEEDEVGVERRKEGKKASHASSGEKGDKPPNAAPAAKRARASDLF